MIHGVGLKMTEILITLIVIGALTVIMLLVRWLIRLPVIPDPWDKEIDKQELDDSSTPICLNCTKPVENPNQHYCPHCGNVTGEYTRYIPFVDIQFNYSIEIFSHKGTTSQRNKGKKKFSEKSLRKNPFSKGFV